jgi:hypothetical protein
MRGDLIRDRGRRTLEGHQIDKAQSAAGRTDICFRASWAHDRLAVTRKLAMTAQLYAGHFQSYANLHRSLDSSQQSLVRRLTFRQLEFLREP